MTNTPLHTPDPTLSNSIAFSTDEFNVIAQFAHKQFGLNLTPSKKDMVYSRLIKRLRKLGLQDFASYLVLLDSAAGKREHVELLSALTTNVTQFFRESTILIFWNKISCLGLLPRQGRAKECGFGRQAVLRGKNPIRWRYASWGNAQKLPNWTLRF